MKEKWVQINKIQGYEDIKDQYWISNSDTDKVINRNTGKQLKICLSDQGYKIVGLQTVDGKTRVCKIHILKACAFIYSPNPLSYNIVRHLNDIKIDNRLINFAWGTASDNMKDRVRNGNYNYEAAIKSSVIGAKKSSKPIRCIETGIIYPSTHEAGRQTGINQSHISHCCNGKRKTAGGFRWQFVDKQE